MSKIKSYLEDEKQRVWDEFMDHFSLYRLERDLADINVPTDEIEGILDEAVEVIELNSQQGVGA